MSKVIEFWTHQSKNSKIEILLILSLLLDFLKK